MRNALWPLVAAAVVAWASWAQVPTDPAPHDQPEPATPAAMWVDYDWHDAARGRDVPVRVWYPTDPASAPWPVIIFSHGLGGSRAGYELFARAWAEAGFVVAMVQHLGSDEGVWRGAPDPLAALRRAAMDPRNLVARPLDVSFALDQVLALGRAADGPLAGRLDAEHLGVAGHSFGAYTALAAVGLRLPLLGAGHSLADPRFDAAVAMSTPAVGRRLGNAAQMYAAVSVPVLHLTGLLDESPIGETTALDRRLPYDSVNAPNQALVVFREADHMVFAGQRRRGDGSHDAEIQGHCQRLTAAFWRSWLRGDDEQRQWLYGEGARAELGEAATMESK